ncbi:MAG: 3-dehydroquinate synthase [Nanoarchaeota archaeon]|nr:3-dehydroquinate synthase [Nanoarchaeota archaeon]MBU1004352.1 3-dehydroquinate synthase [Nanoarchaeota archaeon]MBU1946297.1 3-dehydroquinate synthase [Nanoarchaeota archaeon]
MMEKVRLNLRKEIDNSYEILIDKNLLSKVPSDLKKSNVGNRYLIITDSNIKKLFGDNLLDLMRKEGLKVDILSFKAGEQSKNLETLGELLSGAQKLGLDRKSAIIALGGGVVGDIAGFVAATYMRGINYAQIPTSLLAMADSSVGGKVAVDLPTGKNMAGAFHQPKKVYMDVSILNDLPQKEMINGLSEVVKHAFIIDKGLFDFINKNLSKILDKDLDVLVQLVKRNCEIKAMIVEKDEKEAGLRKIVNYGHTIGHAIETMTHYKKYSHGEAVAMGMVVEGLIARKIGMLSEDGLRLQNEMIKKVGLPVKIPKLEADKVINELKKDKKVVGGKIEFVLLEAIGKSKYGVSASNEIIKEALEESI